MNRKLIGIVTVLAVVVAAAALQSPTFLSGPSVESLLARTALYGLLSIGAAFVIVTGGIDLSIGSVLCLAGLAPPFLVLELGWPIAAAFAAALALALVLGVLHGVLVTRLDLQPFVVTLCGLLVYRGLARGVTGDASVGWAERHREVAWLVERIPVTDAFAITPPMLVLLVVAVAATLVMTRTVLGRYLLALGNNREAARLSGIPTERTVVVAYAISGALAGLAGVLFVVDSVGGKAASLGNFYELYAIAGAVLGGCSLRGGEASIPGVVLGAGLMQVVLSAVRQTGIDTEIEFAIVGGVILVWVVAEELLRRAWRRRARG
ncbi:MAG: ABC transporter permease [Planctomycetes bacterium]|nr:ABC transporter permease [Planctomycetota bacterium]